MYRSSFTQTVQYFLMVSAIWLPVSLLFTHMRAFLGTVSGLQTAIILCTSLPTA